MVPHRIVSGEPLPAWKMIVAFLALSVICLLAAIFGARVLGPGVTDEQLGKALVEYCELNLQYRKQARQRAEANDLSTKLQVAANEALANVVNEIEIQGTGLTSISVLGHKLDRVNAQLNDVRAESTKLLPLPDCTIFRDIAS